MVGCVTLAGGWIETAAKTNTEYGGLSTAAAKCAAFGRDDECYGEMTSAMGWFGLTLLWYLVVLTFRKFGGLSGVLDFLTPESER
jgi:hypothetical protein